jgi:ZIP family zinc transporter
VPLLDSLPELDQRFLFAFLLTLGAGLSTGFGSLLGLLSRRFSPGLLTLSLSFSAGVMLYVSFVEIFPKARLAMANAYGAATGYLLTVLAFFAGMAALALIDRLLPSHELPLLPLREDSVDSRALMRTGLFAALAIAIHNFPEGLATFVAALSDSRLGIDIPEGLAISAPVYFATGSRRKAFWISFASGLAEPVGALVGYLFLRSLLSDSVLGLIFASVAGAMIYICLDELLPAAQRTGARHSLMIGGVIAGMVVMSISLLLLA